MDISHQVVQVFHKDKVALGNHAVIYSEHLPDINTRLKLFSENNIATQCVVKSLHDELYDVRCFNNQYEIQCCGHGMIAAAKTIFYIGEKSKITINNNIYASLNSNKTISLSLPRLSAQVASTPNWLGDMLLFNNKTYLPSMAAITNKDDGYLLLEFEDKLPVDVFRGLQVDLKLICDNTNRGIVLVQFDQANQYLYTRYFAPQYGVVEDNATGSVMRFVGDYIEKKYQCSTFEVSQCSTQGGYMKIECESEKIVISAHAKIESNQ